MPVIRINADGDRLTLHKSPRSVTGELAIVAQGNGPVVVMVHGYKYAPGNRAHCPHRHILAFHPEDMPWRAPSWLRQMGFGTGHADEGLAIAFGWNGRGALWSAHKRAVAAGRALATALKQINKQAPERPIHIMAHSLGIEVVFEALYNIISGVVSRIISMTGASYHKRACDALNTPAGRKVEFINVTSRENDPFDFMFERLITPSKRFDRAIGYGIDAPNAVTLQLDCAGTLDHLDCLGAPLGAPQRRVCHWSSYTRQGILRFYNDLLRQPENWPMDDLRRGLPLRPSRRWSRLVAMPTVPLPLPIIQKS